MTNTTDNVVISGKTIAFQTWSAKVPMSLWLAKVGRRERLVARGEEPVAWTANGLVTQRGNEIRVRMRDGRLVRTLGLGRSATYDAADRTVLFMTRSGALVRTDGFHVWRLARGFARGSWADLVGNRVIDVTTGLRSVFLRPDGSRLGVSAPLDQPAAVMGSVVALPKFRGIVYVVRRYRPGRDPEINVVYLARPHSRARVLYRRRIPALSCDEWTKVSYNHGRILYADDQGPVAILDVAAHRLPLDLTRTLRALQPHGLTPQEMSIEVDWAANRR